MTAHGDTVAKLEDLENQIVDFDLQTGDPYNIYHAATSLVSHYHTDLVLSEEINPVFHSRIIRGLRMALMIVMQHERTGVDAEILRCVVEIENM